MRQEGHKEIGQALKSRRFLGHSAHTAKARPSDAAARELSKNEAYAEAVLSYPRETEVGKVRAGDLD